MAPVINNKFRRKCSFARWIYCEGKNAPSEMIWHMEAVTKIQKEKKYTHTRTKSDGVNLNPTEKKSNNNNKEEIK